MNSDFKIAVVSTIYYPASHADVIVSRWLEPRESDKEWGWNAPKTRIASIFVEQFSALDARDLPAEEFEREKYCTTVDLARLMSEKHDVPLYATVREALTLGGDTLAVDAVLLIGEHGEYPFNELRQKMYPRKELFDEIIAVFQETNQVVPLFCDKHLSWNPQWAIEMFDTTQRMQIPFFAGSSLPLVGLDPPAPDLTGVKLIEYVSLFYVGPEAYGFIVWSLCNRSLKSGSEAKREFEASLHTLGTKWNWQWLKESGLEIFSRRRCDLRKRKKKDIGAKTA